MTVSDKNTRFSLTIPKDLKIIIEEIAVINNRSLNNMVVTILKIYVQDTHCNK